MKLLLAASLTAALTFGPATAQGSMPGMHHAVPGAATSSMSTALDGLQKLNGKAFDRAFLSMMIPHHQMAIDMGTTALKTAKDPTVRRWAKAIIKDQQREIGEMTTWLKTLGGPDTKMQGLMKSAMQGMDDQTGARNPDRAFVQAMLPHHASAIEMATLALQQGTDARVLKVARDIVRAQAQEMHDFRAYLLK